MYALLKCRDALRRLYADYDIFIRPLLKFILAFLLLFLIQSRMGYNDTLSRPVVICACSLLCVFFPFGCISLMGGLFLLGNMFEVSYTMTLFSGIVMLLIFVLYYGFRPGTGLIIALVPLAFYFKIPFLVPVVLGLSVGISSAVPAVLGILVWNVVQYFVRHAESMQRNPADLVEEFTATADSILRNEYMFAVMLAFVLCIVAVALISHSSINHAWTIAVSVGIAIVAICMIAAGTWYGSSGSFGMDILSMVISFFLAILYEYIFYSVDYRGTEHLQFEDDDYYYYVKAVPKIRAYDENERRE